MNIQQFFIKATGRVLCKSIPKINYQSKVSGVYQNRLYSNGSYLHRGRARETRKNVISSALYTLSAIFVFGGLSYVAVPFYKLICTETGIDGTPLTPEANGKVTDPKSMIPVKGAKKIRITFNADVSDSMRWTFKPLVKEIYVVPGETALAFYLAKNTTNDDIVGISTYSVVPGKAAQYFNKIQCFCFEEQKLEAGEEIDMPVFFYIDPEFTQDPWMKDVDTITLSYTFFKSQRDKSRNPQSL